MSALRTRLQRGAAVRTTSTACFTTAITSSHSPSTLVNMALVSLGRPLARTTRTASATASPTPSPAPSGVTENATIMVTHHAIGIVPCGWWALPHVGAVGHGGVVVVVAVALGFAHPSNDLGRSGRAEQRQYVWPVGQAEAVDDPAGAVAEQGGAGEISPGHAADDRLVGGPRIVL